MKSYDDIEKEFNLRKKLLKEPLFRTGRKSAANWYEYTMGYKQAADILADDLEGKHIIGDFFVVYPIIFLYRHYLELLLKRLCDESSRLLDLPLEMDVTHDLLRLWNKTLTNLKLIWSDPNAETDEYYESITKRLEELSNIDKNSDAFRYPVNKRGHAYETELPYMGYIEIQRVKTIVEGISDFLGGASSGIAEYLKEKYAVEAEYSSYEEEV